MWVDSKGMLHTVALPEPQRCLRTPLREIIEASDDQSIMSALALLEDLEESIYERGSSPGGTPRAPLPPEEYPGAGIDIESATLAELFEDAVVRASDEWKLDVVMVLQDSAQEILEARS